MVIVIIVKMLSVHLLVFFVAVVLLIVLILLQLLALNQLGAQRRDHALSIFHLHEVFDVVSAHIGIVALNKQPELRVRHELLIVKLLLLTLHHLSLLLQSPLLLVALSLLLLVQLLFLRQSQRLVSLSCFLAQAFLFGEFPLLLLGFSERQLVARFSLGLLLRLRFLLLGHQLAEQRLRLLLDFLLVLSDGLWLLFGILFLFRRLVLRIVQFVAGIILLLFWLSTLALLTRARLSCDLSGLRTRTHFAVMLLVVLGGLLRLLRVAESFLEFARF